MKRYVRLERPDLARQLLAAGCPLDVEEDDLDSIPDARPGLLIDQVGDFYGTRVFDLDHPQTGYMLDLEIVNNLPGKFVICFFQLVLPWQDPLFSWLPDPSDSTPPSKSYSFPGKDPLEFPREEVINHRTYSRGTLRRGDVIKGWLLGTGPQPIPDCFRQSTSVNMKLSIFDSLERSFSSELSLWVDPSGTLNRERLEEAPASSRSLRSCPRFGLELPDQPRAPEQLDLGPGRAVEADAPGPAGSAPIKVNVSS